MKKYVMAGLWVLIFGVIGNVQADMEAVVKDTNSNFVIKEETTSKLIAHFGGDGQIGFGRTNLTNSFEVNGGVAFHGNHLYIKNPDSPSGYQTWGIVISDANGSYNIGPTTNIPPSGGSLRDIYLTIRSDGTTVVDALAQSSDTQLKENITTLDNPLAKLMQLRGVSFEWKDKTKGTGTKVGLIAQEVETVFPEVVSTDDEGYKSVAYGNLIGVLVESIKELKAQKDAEIAALKAEIEALKASVSNHVQVVAQ